MDFSTVDLALLSLTRRRPPLSDEVLDLSSRLSSLFLSSCASSSSTSPSSTSTHDDDDDDDDDDAEYVRGALRLVELGSSTPDAAAEDDAGGGVRWEPLAVGLRLIVDYLTDRTEELRLAPRVGVYAEGPRIPEIASPPPGEEGSSHRRRHRRLPHAGSPVFELMSALPPIVDANVEHPEPRVRSLVARTVGTYALYATSLLDRRDVDDGASSSSSSLARATGDVQDGRRRIHSAILRSLRHHFLMKEPVRENNASRASDGALDDTTGWRALETNLNALASYVDGCVGGSGGTTASSSESGGGGGGGGSYVDEESSLFVLPGGGTAATITSPPRDDADDDAGDGGEDEEDRDRSWFLPGLRGCCVSHVNRHVRAAGAALVGAIVESCARSPDPTRGRALLVGSDDGDYSDSPFREMIGDALRATLQDNWSQVRMAGSVLCRGYIVALMRMRDDDHGDDGAKNDGNRVKEAQGEEEDEGEEEEVTAFELALGDLVPMLLPRMCLNRFYLAQGVKLYSQETWRIVFGPNDEPEGGGALHSSEGARGGGGIGAVSRCAAPLCRYYSKMCDADNHAVREAACQGVAELAQKIGRHPAYAEFLSPYVTTLLQALLMCFHDESWPVRDEACLACGTFCIAYPEECRPELPTLFDRWTEQLTDQIWSVREDAAVALGDAIEAYGQEMLGKVLGVMRKGIPAARDQPAMSREEYKRLQNDAAAHTGNMLYSCGSLAPKLKKGGAAAIAPPPLPEDSAAEPSSRKSGAGRIGCMSCFVDRPRAPWEATDGCVYLLRELCVRFANADASAVRSSGVVLGDDVLLPLVTELADVCRLSHYPQADDLRTTLWKQLPPIAEALGKRRFKGLYLDLFVEILARNLDDSSGSGATQLSIHAAGQCAEELATLIGIGVFRGRLGETTGGQGAFDRVMEERRRDHQMEAASARCGGGMFYSPFGPPVARSV